MTGNQKLFQRALDEGHSAAWDQDWDKAVQFYRLALEEFPEHTSALSNLALALYELEDFEQSLPIYQKILSLTPSNPVAHEKIARIHEQSGRFLEASKAYINAADHYLGGKEVDKAIECWVQIIRFQPDHLMARTRLAMVYERQGKKAQAVNEYLGTASVMQQRGDISRAVQIVEHCLKLEPTHPGAVKALGYLHSNQPLPKPQRPEPVEADTLSANKEFSRESVSDEVQKNPVEESRHFALQNLAELLFDQAEEEMPETEQGRRGLTSITRGAGSHFAGKVKDSKVLLYLGQAIDAQTRGDDPQTIVELERAVRSGLDHPAVFYLIGLIQSKDEPQKAVQNLQKSFRHPRFALGSYLLLGQTQHKLEQYKEAAIAYLHALQVADCQTASPNQVDTIRQAYEPIIETQSQGKDMEKFKRLCLNIDVQINRNDWKKYIHTVRQQMQNDQSEFVTMPIAEFLLETGTSDVVEAMSGIKKLITRKNYYGALEESFFSLDLAPTYLPLHIQIGDILIQQGKTHAAVDKFMLIAKLYKLRGEATQGIRMLERVTAMAPMNLTIRNQLAEMLIEQGEQKLAVKQLEKIADVHYQLAELEKARETYIEALRLIQNTNGNRTQFIDLLYKKADIDLQTLDFQQAMKAFQQIRSIDPENFKARIQIIDLNFRLGQDHYAIREMDEFIASLNKSGKTQKIEAFLEQLLLELPDKLEIRKKLADLYIHLGKIDDAVKELDVIAESFLNRGNKEAALQVLKSIISLNPSNAAEYQQVYNELKQ